MNALTPNPVTGFLESNASAVGFGYTPFTSDLKLKFLSEMNAAIDREEYPSLDRIAKRVGCSLRTFNEHLRIDPAFRAAYNEVKERLKSVFTEHLALKAFSKYGTVANLAMLRWLESGTWLPETRINHTVNSANENVITGASTVIDAELVENNENNGVSV